MSKLYVDFGKIMQDKYMADGDEYKAKLALVAVSVLITAVELGLKGEVESAVDLQELASMIAKDLLKEWDKAYDFAEELRVRVLEVAQESAERDYDTYRLLEAVAMATFDLFLGRADLLDVVFEIKQNET